MKAPTPLRLPATHDSVTCSDCAAAARDMLRRLERMSRTCRCCGTRIPAQETVYVAGNPADTDDNHWRMCGACWRAGYQRGETVDSERPPA